jgi:GT2 family glycosyltransferase
MNAVSSVLSQDSIAIGIVSCGRGLLTQRCLESIPATTTLPHHVYLVDNGSDAQTLQWLERWSREPNIDVLRLERNLGPAAGRNVILRAAKSKHTIFAMLDNDIVLLTGWDTAAHAALQEGFDVVQPKLLIGDGSKIDRGPTRLWPETYLVHPEYLGGGLDRHAPEVSRRQPNPTFGGTAVLRTAVYERIGDYDEQLWAAEDYDLAFRAVAAGFRACYEPGCEMIHDHCYDPAYDRLRWDPGRMLASHVVMWQKHGKLLLPPSTLGLYQYLYRRGLPAVLPPRTSPFRVKRTLLAIWYRLLNQYFARRGEYWRSAELGKRAMEKAARLLEDHPCSR